MTMDLNSFLGLTTKTKYFYDIRYFSLILLKVSIKLLSNPFHRVNNITCWDRQHGGHLVLNKKVVGQTPHQLLPSHKVELCVFPVIIKLKTLFLT